MLELLPTDKELLTDTLHRMLDEGKIIAADGMLQMKK